MQPNIRMTIVATATLLLGMTGVVHATTGTTAAEEYFTSDVGPFEMNACDLMQPLSIESVAQKTVDEMTLMNEPAEPDSLLDVVDPVAARDALDSIDAPDLASALSLELQDGAEAPSLDLKTSMLAMAVNVSAQAANVAPGDPLIPAGINAGDSFHLVFVTSSRTTREDSAGSGTDNHDINFWNAFVNTVADGSTVAGIPDLNWFAMANTAAVDARDNAPVSAPVFRLDDAQVATGFADLWDGDIAVPINVNEFGIVQTGGGDAGRVWTGGAAFNQSGVAHASHHLGPGGNTSNDFAASIGHMAQTSGGFTTSWFADSDAFRRGPDTALRFYALSEAVTVVAPIPEPATATLALLGLAALSRRRRPAA